ncbi:MAG: hypothetical protein V4696_05110 [Pseudomonadota bacterium]
MTGGVDIQEVGMVVLSVGFGVLGWFARELWSAVQMLKGELAKLEVKMSSDFVRYDRLQDALKPITTTLDRIEGALMHKVDKP